MGFRHVLHLIIIILSFVYVAHLDTSSVLNDDLFFSDTEFSSSTQALAFEQPDFSLDLSSSPSDVFDLPFEETNNSNRFSSENVGLEDTDNIDLFSTNNVDLDGKDNSDLFLIHNAGLDDEPVEVADCSSSEVFPVINKSRIRRRDASDVCIDLGAGHFKSQGLPSDAGGYQSHMRNLGIFSFRSVLRSVLSEKEYESRQNGACKAVTVGSLPWGVCYQPTEVPLQPLGTSVIPPDSGGTLFTSYIVDPGLLGKSKCGAKPCSIC